jgi:CBS-domain-containing membrane protein
MADQADQALLFAKRSGRNRVVGFSEIDESAESALSDQTRAKSPLLTTRAREIMTCPVLSVPSHAPMRDAAEVLLQSRLSSLPVVDDQGALVGTISEKDVLVACVQRDLNELVSGRMATNVVRFDEDAPVQQVFDFFCRSTIRRVFVTHHDAPVGVVSRGALLRYMIHSYRLGFLGGDAQAPSTPSVADQARRGLLAETAGVLGKELHLLRERIAPHAEADDANIIDLVSRIEELMSDLLSPRDPNAFSAEDDHARQQPWSV